MITELHNEDLKVGLKVNIEKKKKKITINDRV